MASQTRFWFGFASVIYSTNAALPGPTLEGVVSVFNTVNLDTQNNCAWQDSEPMTDTTIFPFGNFAGVNTDFFEDAVSCGECYELECVDVYETDTLFAGCQCIPGAKVTVMIVDYGSDVWGNGGQLPYVFDLPSNVAYNILEDTGLTQAGCDTDGSKYDISFRQVCCEHLDDIAVYTWSGTTSHWLAFTLAEVRGYGSITNVWFRENGRSAYWECNRLTNGINKYWVCDPWTEDYDNYYDAGVADGLSVSYGDDPPYSLPIDVKIMDSSGEVLESLDLITSFTPETFFDFKDNYDAACSGGSSSTTPAPTTPSPTTPAPTTPAPTTPAPTTPAPTTPAPTTPSPTTAEPTASDMTTTDETDNYVNCSSVSVEVCMEAFPIGCCSRVNSKCVTADPPKLDGTCSVTTAPPNWLNVDSIVDAIDTDDDGEIDAAELVAACATYATLSDELDDCPTTEDEAKALIALYDTDGDGTLNYAEVTELRDTLDDDPSTRSGVMQYGVMLTIGFVGVFVGFM